jgi:hypothetical protein
MTATARLDRVKGFLDCRIGFGAPPIGCPR